jgi:hypothetical protein
MTNLLTVVTGVLIFVVSQYLLKLVLEPVVELRRTIGKIVNTLSVYHHVLQVPESHEIQIRKEVVEKIEQLSGCLFEAILAIPAYRCIRRIFSLPSQNDILEVADKIQSIAGISQSGAKWTLEKNWLLIIEVFELLRVPIPKPLQHDKDSLILEIINKRSTSV